MKYLLFTITINVLFFSYANAQKKEYYTYVNTNFEVKNSKTSLNINNGTIQKINLFKLEPTIGLLIDFESSAISLGIIVSGWSEYVETLKTTTSYSENIIKTKSYGMEISYILKLIQTNNQNKFIFGLKPNFNYQYVFYNKTLDSYFDYQDDIHLDENLNSSVLSSGLFIVLQQKINTKIIFDVNLGNRFYLPFNNSIYNYSNNHFLITIGIKYKL